MAFLNDGDLGGGKGAREYFRAETTVSEEGEGKEGGGLNRVEKCGLEPGSALEWKWGPFGN